MFSNQYIRRISENIQGITQSEKFWFISNTKTIYRLPKYKKLMFQEIFTQI